MTGETDIRWMSTDHMSVVALSAQRAAERILKLEPDVVSVDIDLEPCKTVGGGLASHIAGFVMFTVHHRA